MKDMQIFNYRQIVEVRMILQDDEPWWVLADVCKVLGIENSRNVVSRLDADEKGVRQMDTPGGPQKMTIINESGLYSVILRSDKPEARAFKRWVTHEVLPSIRRTGRYTMASRMSPLALQGAGMSPLPPVARSLWFTLLWLEQSQGGRGEVVVSNKELVPLLGVSSVHSLRAAKMALEQTGHIRVATGVKGKPTVYTLLKKD